MNITPERKAVLRDQAADFVDGYLEQSQKDGATFEASLSLLQYFVNSIGHAFQERIAAIQGEGKAN